MDLPRLQGVRLSLGARRKRLEYSGHAFPALCLLLSRLSLDLLLLLGCLSLLYLALAVDHVDQPRAGLAREGLAAAANGFMTSSRQRAYRWVSTACR